MSSSHTKNCGKYRILINTRSRGGNTSLNYPAVASINSVDSYLSRRTASSVAVRSRVRVERPRVLLGRLHHAFGHWQVGRSDVGSRQRPLVPRRRGAAVTRRIAGLGPVVAGLVPADHLLLKNGEVDKNTTTGWFLATFNCIKRKKNLQIQKLRCTDQNLTGCRGWQRIQKLYCKFYFKTE